MAGGGAKTARRALDFYPTPSEATRAFLAAERGAIVPHGMVWEPCGRGGAIARELELVQLRTVASDIVADPTNGVAGADLLLERSAWAPAVVTNPPFALARPMIVHLWGTLHVDYLALLLKTQFWNSGKSAALWRDGFRPTRRWDITWRIDFTGAGDPVMSVSWFVWDRRDPREAMGLLDRDGPVGAAPRLL